MLRKIKTILLSRFKKEVTKDFVKERREICATCPHNSLNSKNKTLKIKIIHILSDLYSFITFKKDDLGKCNKCGCSLRLKTAVDFEVCGLEEVGEKPKWVSVFTSPTTQKNKRDYR